MSALCWRGILRNPLDGAMQFVSDDDLPSLDFTLPGLISAPSPDPVLPAPVAKADPFAHLPPALVDAATLHAAGDALGAMRRLEVAIKGCEVPGAAEVRVWQALFEVLRLLERRHAFDALALAFCKRFKLPPPHWKIEVAAQHKAQVISGGHVHVCLEKMLDAHVADVLQEARALAREGAVVCFDLTHLDAADNAGATLLLDLLTALKKAKKAYVLLSPQPLVTVVSAGLAQGRAENEALWLLLLELYQQASMQNEFEDAAVNYAVTFEKSPPSWELLPVYSLPAMPVAAPAAEAGVIPLCGQIVGVGREEFAALAAPGRDELVIDATALLRIDAASARVLQQTVDAIKATGRRIVIRGLSVLNAVFLELQGVARSAELVERSA